MELDIELIEPSAAVAPDLLTQHLVTKVMRAVSLCLREQAMEKREFDLFIKLNRSHISKKMMVLRYLRQTERGYVLNECVRRRLRIHPTTFRRVQEELEREGKINVRRVGNLDYLRAKGR